MGRSERPAERHRQIAAAFTEKVRGTADWDAPAPVEGWTARDVVGHLTEWLASFLSAGADVDLPRGADVAIDPVDAWRVHADAVQALLDAPATSARKLANPQLRKLPLDVAIDRFYTVDVFMHTWDLARATGQNDRLDPAFCAELLAGMEPMEDVMRSSAQYGPRVAVPEGADVQDRLFGFIGRDPSWRATQEHPRRFPCSDSR